MMKTGKRVLAVILGVILSLGGTLMVFAVAGQGTSGNGTQEMTQERVQDPTQNQVEDPIQLQEQERLQEQDQLKDQDRLQERDQLRDQLGMPDADMPTIMNQFRNANRLQLAVEAEIYAYHKLLMLEKAALDSDPDASENVAEMTQELNRIRMEIRERIRVSYSGEKFQAMEMVRTRLMSQFGDVQALKPEAVVTVGWNARFDTPPVIRDGRMLIPVRALSEGFGAEVAWNQEQHQVTIRKGSTVITMIQGSDSAVVNGKVMQLGTASAFMENRVYVPLRFVTEALGCAVEWVPEENMAVIMN